MLETQISEGKHTSCHFCVDKFEGSLDRGLDLSKYELSITDPRSHFHVHYLNRDGDYIEKKLKSPFVKDVVKVIKLFKGNFIDIILASDFTQSGEISNKDINIEIIPNINNYKKIGDILQKNFELPKLEYYKDSFNDYNEKDFAWHIKIKLFRYIKKPLVKFYKTYPNNPYLHFKYYDK